jgi:integrase
MARKKKQIKAKEPIRVRVKKIADGNQSIYLDTYKDGKRSYEFLKLYLIPENNPEDRIRNENTMNRAIAIKNQRFTELQNNEAGIPNSTNNSKMLLADWMRTCAEHKHNIGSEASCTLLEKAASQLVDYKGAAITMKEVDKDFCIGFIEYLKHAKSKCFMRGKSKRKITSTEMKRRIDGRNEATTLKPATARTYVTAFGYALKRAFKKDIILFNPMDKIEADEKIKVPGSIVSYLTINEVRAMAAAQCRDEWVKQAFMFSCFCGLRLSDDEGLTWGDIEQDGTRYKAKLVVEKTERALYQPLSEQAITWLPERDGTKETDKVFLLPSRSTIRIVLNEWVTNAGITKHVTFHTSRHTFAKLLKSKGTALDVIQKSLGHKNITTTQIYADVEDNEVEEAVNLIGGLFDTKAVEVKG